MTLFRSGTIFGGRFLLGAFGLGVGLGCGLAGESKSAEERPVLRVASDATFAPFHFVDSSGAPTGFELELARLVAARAGFESEILVVPYDDLFVGLSRGDFDFVAATTGITVERELEYLFTTPTFRTCQAALVRVGDEEPERVSDLAGRRVGAAGAGTSARALEQLPQSQPVALGKGQEGVPTLLQGVIDALVVDEYDAVVAARASQGRLRVLPEPIALESYGFVLPAGEVELQRDLNRALAELEGEGVIEELKARFGVLRDDAWPIRAIRIDRPDGSER